MILDPSAAALFIDGYTRFLLEVGRQRALRGDGTLIERLMDARSLLLEEPGLMNRAFAALDSQSRPIDPGVVRATRTLDVRRWVYLRDTTKHSIFIDPSGERAFGVVGLTDRINALVKGSGVYLEVGIVFYRGRFVCDGLVSRSVWLGPNYRREFNERLRALKANHQFFC